MVESMSFPPGYTTVAHVDLVCSDSVETTSNAFVFKPLCVMIQTFASHFVLCSRHYVFYYLTCSTTWLGEGSKYFYLLQQGQEAGSK